MKEYLVCKPDYAKKTRFLPAHLIYKIENGHLFREQIPLSLNGGMMVIGKIVGNLSHTLCAKIISECYRFNFHGVFMNLPPLPDESTLDFAKTLLNMAINKNIALHLPLTYSTCVGAYLTVPAINTICSFSEYLEGVCSNYPDHKLSLQLSTQPIAFKIPQETPNQGVPISNHTLKELLEKSGDITFYSPDLCTNYFSCGNRFVVFDTPSTLKVKRDLAEQFAFDSCLYLIPPKSTAVLQKLEENL
ncbi:MAG: hypothetical protein IKU84_01970 [Clostridia bacterium]|nr:hypothetical protein [Clostridia bacterium]